MTLGERVAAARKRLGITQSELARRAELTPAAVWQIEHGDRQPTAETLRKLSEALKVSSDWLLGETSDETAANPRVQAMFRGFSQLSTRDQEALLGLFEALQPDGEE